LVIRTYQLPVTNYLEEIMQKLKFATVWLGGCSGCHMSFLDLDDFLIDLAEKVDVVFSPLADVKAFPEDVDVTLVEGAVANEEHVEMLQRVRKNTKFLISFGDCAVTGNVTAIRNQLGSDNAGQVLDRAYKDAANLQPQRPDEPGIVPRLVERVEPLHALVTVDLYLPGCPPPAPRIRAVIEALLAGQTPEMVGREMIKFG
jgi:NAD-reducing hydrogenase small subunit